MDREKMIKEIITILTRLGMSQKGLEKNVSLRSLSDKELTHLHSNLVKLSSKMDEI